MIATPNSPSRATQLKYADAGKCQQCGKRKPATQTMCGVCRGKHADATAALKLRLVERGTCSQCGVEPLATARCCRTCQDKHNARMYSTRRADRKSV